MHAPRLPRRAGVARALATSSMVATIAATVVATVVVVPPASAQRPDSAGVPRVSVGPNLRVAPGPHNEMWVAVSPTDPNVMVAVAQEGDATSNAGRHASTFVSRDGGRTWATARL